MDNGKLYQLETLVALAMSKADTELSAFLSRLYGIQWESVALDGQAYAYLEAGECTVLEAVQDTILRARK